MPDRPAAGGPEPALPRGGARAVPSPAPRIDVGADIGGTSVKLGVLVDGVAAGERSVDVSGRRAGDVLDDVAAAARELAAAAAERARAPASAAREHGLGVGMPGLLDRASGAVLESPNLPAFAGCDLRSELARRLDVGPELVAVENDANVAALGEARLGAARGLANVLVVTLGTGVGGGLLLDGELVVGEGLAGEIGHVTIQPDGLPCACGSHGCVEMYASATAAQRRAREAGLPDDLPALTERARASAGPERMLLEAVGRDLGHGLACALCLVDVRAFVFGGGFAAALDVLEPGIRRGLAEWAFGARVTAVSLQRAELGPAAGWIGAAHLPRPAPPPPKAAHPRT